MYIYIYIHVCVYLYTDMSIHLCIHIPIYLTFVSIYLYICLQISTYLSINKYVYVYMYIYYIYIYIYIFHRRELFFPKELEGIQLAQCAVKLHASVQRRFLARGPLSRGRILRPHLSCAVAGRWRRAQKLRCIAEASVKVACYTPLKLR